MTRNPEPPAAVARSKAIPEATLDAAIAMYAAGATAREAAARYGMAASTLGRHARLRAVFKCGALLTRVHLSDETWRDIRADYERGFTAGECVRRYGCTEHALRRRAYVERWSKIDPTRVTPLSASLPPAPPAPEEADARWRASTHPAQLAPDGAWRTWLFQGGRGAGKTRAGAEWLAGRAAATPDGRFALIGPTIHDVREVMIDGPSGLLHLPNRLAPQYEATRRRLVFASGAVAYAFSAEEPRRLRGPQFDGAWADEFCAWHTPHEALRILRFALRRGPDPRLVVTTTPKPMPALRALRAETSCVVTQAGTIANAAHLSPTFLDGLTEIYGGTRFAAQEMDGALVENDGGLWRAADLMAARGGKPPDLDRIVVAVDPPAGVGHSACGIVVAGRRDRRCYVLDDRSVAGASPLGWAHAVRDAAAHWGAHEIVAEGNQGGEMVRATLAGADVRAPVRIVHAREGKKARAGPVAALYEGGKVVHCGAFVALEEEMMALGGEAPEGRLDRADALVWAVTALMLGAVAPPGPPRVLPL